MSAIPPDILRAAYEAELATWQHDLARLEARRAASEHIAAALGADTSAHVEQLRRDMERIAAGMLKIEQMIKGLRGATEAGGGAETAG